MCGVCPVAGVRCDFFLVIVVVRDEREWRRVILAHHCLLTRQRHSTGVGSLQGSWRLVQQVTEHISCGLK